VDSSERPLPAPSGRSPWWTRVRVRYLVVPGVLLGIVALALWVLPTNDYLFVPDRAKPLSSQVFVQGARPSGSGDVYYVDVLVRKESLIERIFPFTRPDGSTVVPASDYLTPGTSQQETDREFAEQMLRSQLIAPAIAMRALGYKVQATPLGVVVLGVLGGAPAAGKLRDEDVIVGVDGKAVRTPAELRALIGRRHPGDVVRLTVHRAEKTLHLRVGTIADPLDKSRPIVGINVDQAARIVLPRRVRIDLGRIGGPSAGLPFALEVMRKLGRNVTGKCKVAATGELTLGGQVLPIGGLEQKVVGVRRAGVDLFLVPYENDVAKARKQAGGVRVIPVKSFQQALQVLATATKKC
jgi:PDZ domain-containing protein